MPPGSWTRRSWRADGSRLSTCGATRGGDAWEWEEPCREQHSSAAFRAMADEGVTTFITYYHKGMGWEVTADERADVKRQVAELHRLGMRAGVYFRIDNVFPETFFLEIPAARNWLLKTENGTTPNVTSATVQIFKISASGGISP